MIHMEARYETAQDALQALGQACYHLHDCIEFIRDDEKEIDLFSKGMGADYTYAWRGKVEQISDATARDLLRAEAHDPTPGRFIPSDLQRRLMLECDPFYGKHLNRDRNYITLHDGDRVGGGDRFGNGIAPPNLSQ